TAMVTASRARAMASRGGNMCKAMMTLMSSIPLAIQPDNCRTLNSSKAPQNSDSTPSLNTRRNDVFSFISWVQRVAQAIAHEIQAQQSDCEKPRGKQQAPRCKLHFTRAFIHQHSPRGGRLLHAEAEKAEKRFHQDDLRHCQCGVHHDDAEQVRHDVAQHDHERMHTERASRKN